MPAGTATSPGISQGQDKPPSAGLDRIPAMRRGAIKGVRQNMPYSLFILGLFPRTHDLFRDDTQKV